MTTANYQKYRKMQGFENIDPNLSPYDKVLTAMHREMINRNDDKHIIKIKDSINPYRKYKPIANFASNKVYDHKSEITKHIPLYYSKTEKNKEGKAAAVWGVQIPGDKDHVYDYDIWSNIHYGYAMMAAQRSELLTHTGSKVEDFLKNSGDEPAVQLGIELYKKYGDKLTKEQLAKEIYAHRDKLNRYNKSDLIGRVKENDTLQSFLKNNNLTEEEFYRYNPDLKRENQTFYPFSHGDAYNVWDTKTQTEIPERFRKPDGISTPLPVRLAEKDVPQKEEPVGQTPLPQVKKAENMTVMPSTTTNYTPITTPQEKVAKPVAREEELTPEDEEEIERQFASPLFASDQGEFNILFKEMPEVTMEEARAAQKAAMFDVQEPDLRQRLDRKVSDFYDYVYGAGPVRQDDTGRPIDPQPKVRLAEEVSALRTKEKMPLSQAYRDLSKELFSYEKLGASGAKALQRGLNILGGIPALKEDGDLGPKTVLRLKEHLTRSGSGAVKRNAALGAFETMLENKRHQTIEKEKLGGLLHKIRPQDGPKLLQKGLNALGKDDEDYEPLKEDNDFGPVTANVFNRLKEHNEDGLKGYFRKLVV